MAADKVRLESLTHMRSCLIDREKAMRWMTASFVVLSVVAMAAASSHAKAPAAIQPVVEIEEDVYRFEPANNGAGPLWCHGSTCIVRIGDEVFASGIETLKGFKPLNNCRWLLWNRTAQGW